MKNLKYTLLLFLAFATVNLATAQTKEEKKKAKQAYLKEMIDAQLYTFAAQYANPMGGGHRFLTSDYDVRFKKDSIIAYLPYFGQAYFDVPYNANDGGIKFTSTKFTYKATVRKKGGWDIVIHPKDAKYVQTMNLYISANGYSTLQFTITNKSAISFDGYIKDKEEKKNSLSKQ